MLEELNVPGTPSFYALREMQKRLAEEMDIRPREHISTLGKKFHAIAPEDLLALVGDACHRILINYLQFTGLGQPACATNNASIPRGNLFNQRVVADGEMVQ